MKRLKHDAEYSASIIKGLMTLTESISSGYGLHRGVVGELVIYRTMNDMIKGNIHL